MNKPTAPAAPHAAIEPPFALHAQMQSALELHGRGLLAEAQALYLKVLHHHPGHFDARHLLGMIALQNGDAERGVEWIAHALALDPGHALAHANLGRGYQVLGRHALALASFDRALALGPGDLALHFNRALTLFQLRQYAAALAGFEQVLALEPTLAEAWSNHGNALRELQRPDAALASFARALALKPELVEAHANRANVLADLGRHDDALHALAQALALKPDYFDALSNRAKLLLKLERHAQALQAHDRLLAHWPALPLAWSNRGNVLFHLGRLDEALADYARAVSLQPDFVEAWCNHGNTLSELGRHAEAVVSLQRALAIQPDFHAALSNLGTALAQTGRPHEAIAQYDRALALKPDHAATLSNRGNVLRTLRRFDDALACFDRGLALAPESPELLANRANALFDLWQFDAALAQYDAALARGKPGTPAYALALSNRSGALRALKRYDEALASSEAALQIQTQSAVLWSNHGNILCEFDRYESGLACYDRALALNPRDADAISNRANALRAMRRYDAALAGYAAALALDPQHTQVQLNASICRLLTGDFEAGWAQYEWRFKTEGTHRMHTPRRVFDAPRWSGREPLAGKHILLHAEQGFGDTLQFCRYVHRVAELGAHVILEVQPALKRLLGSLAGVGTLIAEGEPWPRFDYHCPLLSLPLAFGTTLATIPASRAYLHTDVAHQVQWVPRLDALREPGRTGLRIGLGWAGSKEHRNDHKRSLPLPLLARLSDAAPLRQHQYVCLHKELGTQGGPARMNPQAERDWLAQHAIAFVGDELADFADTAALIMAMDLVITVDTSLAHLAGALGKPAWVMLPHNPDWRWLTERTDSPWYPSLRLFRQATRGDWAGVLSEVAQALQHEPKARAAAAPPAAS
jgi:tetratricopeptide (TPR) repeat protein